MNRLQAKALNKKLLIKLKSKQPHIMPLKMRMSLIASMKYCLKN